MDPTSHAAEGFQKDMEAKFKEFDEQAKGRFEKLDSDNSARIKESIAEFNTSLEGARKTMLGSVEQQKKKLTKALWVAFALIVGGLAASAFESNREVNKATIEVNNAVIDLQKNIIVAYATIKDAEDSERSGAAAVKVAEQSLAEKESKIAGAEDDLKKETDKATTQLHQAEDKLGKVTADLETARGKYQALVDAHRK